MLQTSLKWAGRQLTDEEHRINDPNHTGAPIGGNRAACTSMNYTGFPWNIPSEIAPFAEKTRCLDEHGVREQRRACRFPVSF
jgi:hypothetical protein